MEVTYNDRVFAYLIQELKMGESKDIRYLASPETRGKFIDTVIVFIQCGYDIHYGFVLEVSADRQKIKKSELYIFNEKPKTIDDDEKDGNGSPSARHGGG